MICDPCRPGVWRSFRAASRSSVRVSCLCGPHIYNTFKGFRGRSEIGEERLVRSSVRASLRTAHL